MDLQTKLKNLIGSLPQGPIRLVIAIAIPFLILLFFINYVAAILAIALVVIVTIVIKYLTNGNKQT
jgi:hypothetical protein